MQRYYANNFARRTPNLLRQTIPIFGKYVVPTNKIEQFPSRHPSARNENQWASKTKVMLNTFLQLRVKRLTDKRPYFDSTNRPFPFKLSIILVRILRSVVTIRIVQAKFGEIKFAAITAVVIPVASMTLFVTALT